MRIQDLIDKWGIGNLSLPQEVRESEWQPTEADRVWRLPPSLRAEDDVMREANLAIGESDRMTMRFVKPE